MLCPEFSGQAALLGIVWIVFWFFCVLRYVVTKKSKKMRRHRRLLSSERGLIWPVKFQEAIDA
jgi:hypothetical protein